jgi:hypothetical protein
MPLGTTFKPMLFLATVTKWQTRKPVHDRRVRATAGTQYLLNTNRIDGIRAMTDTNYSSLYYFENPFDNRENSGYMEVYLTVTQLKAQINTVPTNVYMTLPLYPNMDKTKTLVSTTIPIANFTFAVLVVDDAGTTDTLVYYVDSGWKLRRARTSLTPTQILALVA